MLVAADTCYWKNSLISQLVDPLSPVYRWGIVPGLLESAESIRRFSWSQRRHYLARMLPGKTGMMVVHGEPHEITAGQTGWG